MSHCQRVDRIEPAVAALAAHLVNMPYNRGMQREETISMRQKTKQWKLTSLVACAG
jgi:hypothetical protein